MIRSVLSIGLRASARCLAILIFALSACQSNGNDSSINQIRTFSSRHVNHRDCTQPQSADDECQDDDGDDDDSVDGDLDDTADGELDGVDSDVDEDIDSGVDTDVDSDTDEVDVAVTDAPSALPSLMTIASPISHGGGFISPPPIVLNPLPTEVPLPHPCSELASRTRQGFCKPSSQPTLSPCVTPKGGNTMLDQTQSANSLIQGSPALQALLAQLSNMGITVNIQGGSLEQPHDASSQLIGDTATIIVDSANIAAAEADRGDMADQILYHELDHIYYDASPAYELPPASSTFTIGTATYNFNTANVKNSSGMLQASSGEIAFSHMLINNDLINAFQSDATGSLYEGIAGASPPPGAYGSVELANAVSAAAGKKGTSSRNVTPPSLTAKCVSDMEQQIHKLLQQKIRMGLAAGLTYYDIPFIEDPSP